MTTAIAPLLAFHSDRKIKAHYLRRVRAHRKADQIVKGQYWKDGKGCAVGCTIHGSNHGAYEAELGIPKILARLEDVTFQAMDNGRAQAWPERFLKAITPGADLSLVWSKFAVWLMIDEQWGVLRYAKTDAARKAIQDVADAYQGVVEESKSKVDWLKLHAAAHAVAYDDDAYSYDAAVYVAYDAAAFDSWAAAYDAAYAHAIADAAKWKEAIIVQSSKLIELLQAA